MADSIGDLLRKTIPPALPSPTASICSYGCGAKACEDDGCYRVKGKGSPPVECRCSTQRESDTCAIRSGSAGCTRDMLPQELNVLDLAAAAVSGPRRGYGSPWSDFSQVSYAALEMGLELGNPLHHALYMILVKISRLVATPDHKDSLVDIAGYALTYEMCLNEME